MRAISGFSTRGAVTGRGPSSRARSDIAVLLGSGADRAPDAGASRMRPAELTPRAPGHRALRLARGDRGGQTAGAAGGGAADLSPHTRRERRADACRDLPRVGAGGEPDRG